MTDRYAVFGNPVEHSRSPDIHRLFALQTGEDMSYQRQLVALGAFDRAADDFFNGGGKGLNITLPFKLDAFGYASELTSRARRAGAVNTLALQADGGTLGDNTDGHGLVRDMVANLQWRIAGQSVLVLGAGGAARGALAPLLGEGPAIVVVANRTVDKARQLALAFDDLGPVKGCGFDDLAGECFDLIINATSASLAGDLPPLPSGLISRQTCCYDMMYGPEPTVFMRWALAKGAVTVADGLGMLVEQAAESFYLWRGVRPLTTTVVGDIRQQL